MKPNKHMPGYIIIQPRKVEDKEKISKAMREKLLVTYKEVL